MSFESIDRLQRRDHAVETPRGAAQDRTAVAVFSFGI